MTRDRLVCRITNNAVRKLLLREDDLTSTKAIHICEVNGLSDRRIKALSTRSLCLQKYMSCERKTEEMLGKENRIKTKSAVVIAELYMLKVDSNVRLMGSILWQVESFLKIVQVLGKPLHKTKAKTACSSVADDN